MVLTDGAGAARVSAERHSHTTGQWVTFAAEAGSPGGHNASDSGGDNSNRDSTRPALTTSPASTATTVDKSF